MKRLCSYALLALFSLLAFSSTAHAAASDNIIGYAWSSNIGWISFNCVNESCASTNYGVNKNPDGTLTGYAWSSSVGWIQFGGLAGFPTGGGTLSQNAQVVGTSLVGWAKAISADNNGWDGWISLTGTGYGVTQSGLGFAGYAWGSDVTGWIQFDPGSQNPGVCSSACDARLAGSASFDIQSGGTSIAGNGAVPYNTIPTFVWTITNLPSVSCAITKTAGSSPFSTPITGKTATGTTTEDALSSSGLHTYSLDCTNPTVSQQISFTVAAQPPGFSIGSSDAARIQLLNSGVADSEQNNIFVTAVGGFTNPVTISITGYPSAPASTTYSYSLGGSAFSATPSAVVVTSPYAAGTSLKVRVTRLAGAPAITNPFTVTLTGTASGATNAQKLVVVTPVTFNPTFQER